MDALVILNVMIMRCTASFDQLIVCLFKESNVKVFHELSLY